MEPKQIITAVKEILPTPKTVYFIGCGGSMIALYSAHYLIKQESCNIDTDIYTANEFVHAVPKKLDKDCICIICSLSATAETVEAIRVANKAGAVTIAMSGNEDTLTAKTGRFCTTYTKGAAGNQATALKLAFEILYQYESYGYYNEAMAAYDKIDSIIETGLTVNKGNAERFAVEFKDDPVFYVMASGPMYASAYTMSCCHLMEMQWKHAIAVHSGEYFHGPFETTDKNLPIILLKSCGRTRPLDERAEKFITQYSDKVIIVDMAKFGMDQIDPHVAEFFDPAVMFAIEREMVSRMSVERDHPMEKRRYMWQFDY